MSLPCRVVGWSGFLFGIERFQLRFNQSLSAIERIECSVHPDASLDDKHKLQAYDSDEEAVGEVSVTKNKWCIAVTSSENKQYCFLVGSDEERKKRLFFLQMAVS